MLADDALLFIDANKYLDLYRTHSGKKLLAPLKEQAAYIFVTQQVVAEVKRNKIMVASEFLGQKSNTLKVQTSGVPDHLSGPSAGQDNEIRNKMREISAKADEVNKDIDNLTLGILEQISCSKDEVSEVLIPIFDKAVSHSPEELQKAKDRKELGNPPGKSTNALGDQLTWEQILTHFQGKKRLWIISRDCDYGTFYSGKGFLNCFLYEELCKITSTPEVYLFTELVEGINHFLDTTGVKADNRLTPEETEEIEREEKSLPHLPQVNTRTLADLAKFSQSASLISEAQSKIIADAAKFSQPISGVNTKSITDAITKFSQSASLISETQSKMIADLARFSQPISGVNTKSITDAITKLSQSASLISEAQSKMIADLARFSQPISGVNTKLITDAINKINESSITSTEKNKNNKEKSE